MTRTSDFSASTSTAFGIVVTTLVHSVHTSKGKPTTLRPRTLLPQLILKATLRELCQNQSNRMILHSSLRLQLRSGDSGHRWSSPVISAFACSLALAFRSHNPRYIASRVLLAEIHQVFLIRYSHHFEYSRRHIYVAPIK